MGTIFPTRLARLLRHLAIPRNRVHATRATCITVMTEGSRRPPKPRRSLASRLSCICRAYLGQESLLGGHESVFDEGLELLAMVSITRGRLFGERQSPRSLPEERLVVAIVLADELLDPLEIRPQTESPRNRVRLLEDIGIVDRQLVAQASIVAREFSTMCRRSVCLNPLVRSSR